VDEGDWKRLQRNAEDFASEIGLPLPKKVKNRVYKRKQDMRKELGTDYGLQQEVPEDLINKYVKPL
jgi:hypothetical protein